MQGTLFIVSQNDVDGVIVVDHEHHRADTLAGVERTCLDRLRELDRGYLLIVAAFVYFERDDESIQRTFQPSEWFSLHRAGA